MPVRTYSELTRASSESEALYRAANNDVIHHQGDAYADAIRVDHPSTRIFSYQLYRMATASVAAEWDAHCAQQAIDPEQGYLHIAGVRRQNPSAQNWYVMNMGNAAYVTWQHLNTLKVFLGIRYGAAQFTYPPALNAVLMDLTLWWSNYDDVNHENVLGTDEYAGTGDLYRTHCRQAFEGALAYIAAAGIGADRVVYPNFGSITECERADPDTQAVIASASTLICAEFGVSWGATSGEPNYPAESCELRWASIASLLNGTRELMLDGFVLASATQAMKDRAKVGQCAWMLMAYAPGMLSRFYYAPEDAASHISTWEDSALLRIASTELALPSSAFSVVAGAWTKGKLYTRPFAHGRIYLFVRKAGQVGAESIVVPVTTSEPLDAAGNRGAAVSEVTLSLGEAAILLDAAPLLLKRRRSEIRTRGVGESRIRDHVRARSRVVEIEQG